MKCFFLAWKVHAINVNHYLIVKYIHPLYNWAVSVNSLLPRCTRRKYSVTWIVLKQRHNRNLKKCLKSIKVLQTVFDCEKSGNCNLFFSKTQKKVKKKYTFDEAWCLSRIMKHYERSYTAIKWQICTQSLKKSEYSWLIRNLCAQ